VIKSFRHRGVERFFSSGSLAGSWSVWVDANWRLVFMFDGVDVIGVDYLDYH